MRIFPDLRFSFTHFRAFLAALVLNASILTTTAIAQNPSISVGSDTAAANTDIDITVSFAPGALSVSALQFDILLPPSLSVVSVSAGTAATAAGKVTADAAVTGGHRVLLFGFNTNAIGAGALAVMRFHVGAGTFGGTIPLSITGVVSSNAAGDPVPTDSSSGSIIVPDVTFPSVSITAPSAGATVGGTIQVTADASDDVGVVGVQFKLDGNNLGAEDTNSPFSASWNTTSATAGAHVLTAVARDAAGHSTTSTSVNVTVSNVSIDNTPPTVSVTGPSAGATVSGNVNVSANASDNVGVAGVQFKVDGANLGAEDTVAPYLLNWNTLLAANGSHSLTAVARDASGNSTTSLPISVTVSNSVDGTPPTVSITAPNAGTTVNGTISITANASDNFGVVGVQFRVDGANFGSEDLSAPYSIPWNTALYPNGSHSVLAVARDAAGNTTVSSAVAVTVSNTTIDSVAPNVSITSPTPGARASGLVAFNATASDNVGVIGVQFKVDNTNVGVEDIAAPFAMSWDSSTVGNGTHLVTALARDAAGNSRTSTAVSITVSNIPPDTSSPVRSAGSPTGELPPETGGATITVLTNENAACRFDAKAGVVYSEMSSVLLSADKRTHTATVAQLTNGSSYSFYVRCIDDAGNANLDDFLITFEIGTHPVSRFRDFDGDGNSELLLYGRKRYRAFAAGDELPGDGSVFTGKLSQTWIGTGDITGKGVSSIVLVRKSKGTLIWEQIAATTGKKTSLVHFGVESDIPVIGCHAKGNFVPVVVTKDKNTSTITFVPPARRKGRSFRTFRTLNRYNAHKNETEPRSLF